MKKLLGIVVLGLLFCNNVNAGFHKFTFDRCNGEKNFPVIGGLSWEINFEKRTLTLFEVIKIEVKDNNQEITKGVVFQERYGSEHAIQLNQPFIHIRECCDRTQYNFNMKTGKIIQIHGWTGEETVIGMCEIVD